VRERPRSGNGEAIERGSFVQGIRATNEITAACLLMLDTIAVDRMLWYSTCKMKSMNARSARAIQPYKAESEATIKSIGMPYDVG